MSEDQGEQDVARPIQSTTEQSEQAPTVRVLGTVPVQVLGPPTTTREIAKHLGQCTNITVDTGGDRILGRDPRRARVTLMALDDVMHLSRTKAGLAASTAAIWPQSTPLDYYGEDELWVSGDSTDTRITIIGYTAVL